KKGRYRRVRDPPVKKENVTSLVVALSEPQGIPPCSKDALSALFAAQGGDAESADAEQADHGGFGNRNRAGGGEGRGQSGACVAGQVHLGALGEAARHHVALDGGGVGDDGVG